MVQAYTLGVKLKKQFHAHAVLLCLSIRTSQLAAQLYQYNR